jgi:hypothetical protein
MTARRMLGGQLARFFPAPQRRDRYTQRRSGFAYAYEPFQSGRRGATNSLAPLRAVRATFTAYGSSSSKDNRYRLPRFPFHGNLSDSTIVNPELVFESFNPLDLL